MQEAEKDAIKEKARQLGFIPVNLI